MLILSKIAYMGVIIISYAFGFIIGQLIIDLIPYRPHITKNKRRKK